MKICVCMSEKYEFLYERFVDRFVNLFVEFEVFKSENSYEKTVFLILKIEPNL